MNRRTLTVAENSKIEWTQSLALWAVRILRRLPHTRKLDAHLTDCAALAVLYFPFGDAPEDLRLSHVFRLVPLPRFIPSDAEVMNEGVTPALTDRDLRGNVTPVVIDAAHLFKGGLQPTL